MIPHDIHKWGVHVRGPDTIIAAIDFHQACEKATMINDTIRMSRYPGKMLDYYPVVFANVFMWDFDLHGGHDPHSSVWEDIT